MRTSVLAALMFSALLLAAAGIVSLTSMVPGPADLIAFGLLAVVGVGLAAALMIRHRALKRFGSDVGSPDAG